ncbi:Methylmalonate-semialdehyde dehydrogenase [Globisporangium polare]
MASSPNKRMKTEGSIQVVNNLIDGEFVAPLGSEYVNVVSPVTGDVIASCAVSSAKDVDVAVQKGQEAFKEWSKLTVKTRAAVMLKFHALMSEHADELADIVVKENGKNKMEALASVLKGNETVEYACSLPQLVQGRTLQVSRGITCHETRDPLGVVACVVPFNFPIMVPMWTIPIALTLGNCVILKPSEKVPLTMQRVAELLLQAGVPKGVFQIINGKADAVTSLCDHPKVKAVTFVGSSHVAQLVSRRCRAQDKRVLALGGAKNHLVALPDADAEMAAKDIVASYAGCAGQRCMAASVLLLVGDCDELLNLIVEKSKVLKRGTEAGQVGAVIDHASKDRILKYINEAEQSGVKVLVDGRSWANEAKGSWVGPTVLLHTNPNDPAMKDEIFGPVLSIYKVKSFDEALEIENGNDYGNAASIYTSNGGFAEYFQSRFRAGMIGVNIGIPVPREPFSFGGMYGTKSKYGDMDITGDGCVEFFSNRRKITSKWSTTIYTGDKANFSGQI